MNINIQIEKAYKHRKGMVKVQPEKKRETKKWKKREIVALILLLGLMFLAGIKSNEDLKLEQRYENHIEQMKNVDQ